MDAGIASIGARPVSLASATTYSETSKVCLRQQLPRSLSGSISGHSNLSISAQLVVSGTMSQPSSISGAKCAEIRWAALATAAMSPFSNLGMPQQSGCSIRTCTPLCASTLIAASPGVPSLKFVMAAGIDRNLLPKAGPSGLGGGTIAGAWRVSEHVHERRQMRAAVDAGDSFDDRAGQAVAFFGRPVGQRRQRSCPSRPLRSISASCDRQARFRPCGAGPRGGAASGAGNRDRSCAAAHRGIWS